MEQKFSFPTKYYINKFSGLFLSNSHCGGLFLVYSFVVIYNIIPSKKDNENKNKFD